MSCIVDRPMLLTSKINHSNLIHGNSDNLLPSREGTQARLRSQSLRSTLLGLDPPQWLQATLFLGLEQQGLQLGGYQSIPWAEDRVQVSQAPTQTLYRHILHLFGRAWYSRVSSNSRHRRRPRHRKAQDLHLFGSITARRRVLATIASNQPLDDKVPRLTR